MSSAAPLPPRASGSFIASVADHVTIRDARIRDVAERVVADLQSGKISFQNFKCNSIIPLDLGLTHQQLLDWTFVVDALNFNFWTPDGQPKFTVMKGSKRSCGYLAMVAAVNRAIAEGKPFYDPNFYGELSRKDIEHIFRSDTSSQMPLFEERVRVLGEVAAILREKFQGSFENVLKLCDNDAVRLVEVIAAEFPCFKDEAVYKGKRVSLYKRAQIVAADVNVLLNIQGKPGLKNLSSLTMFADYRVPQVLLHFGVLEYSQELMEKLRKEHLFENGSAEEVEIRGCSIEAVERVVAECRKLLPSAADVLLNSACVDFFLWDYRVTNAKRLLPVPYHRTRCIYY